MTGAHYDAIVIGGGHNGLTCAAYLAKSGQRTLVLEAAEALGGAAQTREFAPGFQVSAGAHLLYALDPKVESDLGLTGHGLSYAARGLATTALGPEGQRLRFATSGLEGAVSEADRRTYPEFKARMLRFAALLRGLMNDVPPRLGTKSWDDRKALLKHGWALKRMGKAEMQEFLRVAGSNIYDLSDDTFEGDLVKGALSLDAVLGTHLGPRSPGSVFTLLYRWAGEAAGEAGGLAIPQGGMGGATAALAKAAEGAGAELRCGAPVERVLIEDDRARGVVLAGGEEIAAGKIISSADPRRSFLGLIGARHLDTNFAHHVAKLRMRGNAAKLHLALDGPPAFKGLEDLAGAGRLVIAPDAGYVERAFNPAKYGEYSPQPVMEITLPSIHDNTLAPEGQHVLSAVVQYAPHGLKAGWDKAREAFAQTLVDLLEGYAPGIKDQIVARELLTPEDIEAQFGLTGGQWHQVELAFDQFLMLRPLPGAAQYATPVPGFFLCGAGCHPGGGVMGTAGRLAAGRIIAGA